MFDDYLHKDKRIQEQFLKIHKKFMSCLEKQSRFTRRYGFVHSLPVVHREEDSTRYKQVYSALMSGVCRVVQSYYEDKDVQKVMSLPENLRSIISAFNGKYTPGLLRPDFLIDSDLQPKFCEINARFPFNGYFISYHANNALKKVQKLLKVRALDELDNFPCMLERLYGNVSVIKEAEPDYDIVFFCEKTERNSFNVQYIRPSKLSVSDGKLFYGRKKLETIVLELQQWEIAKHFTEEHALALKNHAHVNDLRTILIAHDKRLFDLLYDSKTARRYLNGDEKKLLEPYLIETHAANKNKKILGRAACEKDSWVLKPALKGKGQQLYIGSEMTQDSWKIACKEAEKEPFVVQRRVEEHNFSLYVPHLGIVKMPLVVTLLGVDKEFVSQGIYRGKFYDLTNISDGFVFVLPALSE